MKLEMSTLPRLVASAPSPRTSSVLLLSMLASFWFDSVNRLNVLVSGDEDDY